MRYVCFIVACTVVYAVGVSIADAIKHQPVYYSCTTPERK